MIVAVAGHVATGTFLVRASFDNPNGVLRPNQHVRARIHGAIRPKAILVPQRAVLVPVVRGPAAGGQ